MGLSISYEIFLSCLFIITIIIHSLRQKAYLFEKDYYYIANAQIQSKLRQLSQQRGYELPILCTPYELLPEDSLCGKTPL